ncbi:MAG: hypothetical protein QNJ43_22435 [Breoghania sp.]|nr:hypothetical protein [Breoghania sp.]
MTEEYPEDPSIPYELAICFRLAGQCDKGLEATKEALRLSLHTILRCAHAALGAINDAERHLPNNVDLRPKKGRLLRELGHLEQAAGIFFDLLEEIPSAAPRRTNIEFDLAITLRGCERHEEALETHDEILEREPLNTRAWIARIDTSLHFLLIDDTLTTAEAALTALPDDPLRSCLMTKI